MSETKRRIRKSVAKEIKWAQRHRPKYSFFMMCLHSTVMFAIGTLLNNWQLLIILILWFIGMVLCMEEMYDAEKVNRVIKK